MHKIALTSRTSMVWGEFLQYQSNRLCNSKPEFWSLSGLLGDRKYQADFYDFTYDSDTPCRYHDTILRIIDTSIYSDKGIWNIFKARTRGKNVYNVVRQYVLYNNPYRGAHMFAKLHESQTWRSLWNWR